MFDDRFFEVWSIIFLFQNVISNNKHFLSYLIALIAKCGYTTTSNHGSLEAVLGLTKMAWKTKTGMVAG